VPAARLTAADDGPGISQTKRKSGGGTLRDTALSRLDDIIQSADLRAQGSRVALEAAANDDQGERRAAMAEEVEEEEGAHKQAKRHPPIE
jgi:hypothetical protein